MADIITGTDLYAGWYKLLVPEIRIVLGDLFLKPELLIPMLYTKLGGESVSFDNQLSVPMLFLDKPVLVLNPDKTINANIVAENQLPQLVPLSYINRFSGIGEHESRCYIPAEYITAIIPVHSKCPLAKILHDLTNESPIQIAQPGQVNKIIDFSKK